MTKALWTLGPREWWNTVIRRVDGHPFDRQLFKVCGSASQADLQLAVTAPQLYNALDALIGELGNGEQIDEKRLRQLIADGIDAINAADAVEEQAGVA